MYEVKNLSRIGVKRSIFASLVLTLFSFMMCIISISSSFAAFGLIAAFVIGVPFGSSCYSFLSIKKGLIINTLFTIYAMYLIFFWSRTPIEFIGAIILGISGGYLLTTLPYILVADFFPSEKASTLGKILLFSTSLTCFFFYALKPNIALLMAVSSISILSGSFFLFKTITKLKKAEIAIQNQPLPPIPKETKRQRKNRIKISIFFLFIALSAGLTARIKYIAPQSEQANYSWLLIAGLLLSPIITSLFINRKGIYSGCILLIFLAEFSLTAAGLYLTSPLISQLGDLTFGLLLPALAITCPVLTFYMLGPAAFGTNISRVIVALPIGFSAVIPLYTIETRALLASPIIYLCLFLLVCSFFTIFSAWSHRLILLK